MGEGREEDMGQGIGALPTEVGRSAAPDGVEPASPSQAKPAAANARMTGEQQIADELREIASEMNCCQRQMHLEIAAQIVEQGQFAHPDTFGMQVMVDELLEALQEIINPVAAMQDRAKAEGLQLDGMMANMLARDPEYLRGIARAAIAKAEASDA